MNYGTILYSLSYHFLLYLILSIFRTPQSVISHFTQNSNFLRYHFKSARGRDILSNKLVLFILFSILFRPQAYHMLGTVLSSDTHYLF